MAAVAAVPWKEILRALPVVVSTADKLWRALSSKSKKSAVDPDADLKTQIGELASRLQENEVTQTEQAKVVALMVEQMQALAARFARSYWLSLAALALACVGIVVALLR